MQLNTQQLITIAHVIGAQFGPDTEVVVHDFTQDLDHTIVYICNGHVSGRSIGDGPSQSFLKFVNVRDHGQEKIRITAHTVDGKIIRSSTANFFDEDGALVGSLCINQDITHLVALEDTISHMADAQYFETSALSSDGDNDIPSVSIHSLMDDIISEGLSKIGTPPDKMNKEAKLKLLTFLDKRGVFLIQKSGQRVCDLLGISKFTLYNYLDEIRGNK